MTFCQTWDNFFDSIESEVQFTSFLFMSAMQWRSLEFTSGWTQTEKIEDLPMNLLLYKRFSKFFEWTWAFPKFFEWTWAFPKFFEWTWAFPKFFEWTWAFPKSFEWTWAFPKFFEWTWAFPKFFGCTWAFYCCNGCTRASSKVSNYLCSA